MSHIIWGIDVQCQELRSLALLNGYPVVMPVDAGEHIMSAKLNPFIIEGPNELRIRLGRAEDGASLAATARYQADLFRTPHGVMRDDSSYLVRYEWDREEQELAEDGMTDVLTHRFEASPADAFGRWAWQDALPFDPGQRVAIELLVGRCREALVERDPDKLLALLSLQLAETAHALGVRADELEQDLRDHLEPFFAADGWEVAPIDYGIVSLIPSTDGKLVLVMGHRGAPILQGQIVLDDESDPLPPFMMELCVSNLDGTWTVVR